MRARRLSRLHWAMFATLFASTANAVRLDPVMSQPSLRPVQVAGPGDGRLYVVGQDGDVQRIDEPGRGELLLDLREEVFRNGESGLLSMAFHPEFLVQGAPGEGLVWVYLSHRRGTQWERVDEDVLLRFRVPRGATAADPSSRREVLRLRSGSCHHGGQLLFGPPEGPFGTHHLYLSVGDGCGNADVASDWTSPKGKILRMIPAVGDEADPFTVPADNPYPGSPGLSALAIAKGVRNPWRCSFDESGALWIADVGSGGYEEVNVLQPGVRGVDFGWPDMEGPKCWMDGCAPFGVLPRWWYPTDDGCAIIGGLRYRGSAMPWLRGQYVFGDYSARSIEALSPASDGTWIARRIAEAPAAIQGIGEDADGEILVACWDWQAGVGSLLRLAGDPDPLTLEIMRWHPLGGSNDEPNRLRVHGGASAPEWSLEGDPLPAGARWSGMGLLDGTGAPAFPPQSFVLRATDSRGTSDVKHLCLGHELSEVSSVVTSGADPTAQVAWRQPGAYGAAIVPYVVLSSLTDGACATVEVASRSTYGDSERIEVNGIPRGVSEWTLPRIAVGADEFAAFGVQLLFPYDCPGVGLLSWRLDVTSGIFSCEDDDGDGVVSTYDACRTFADPGQAGRGEGDLIGDACDMAWGDVAPAGAPDGVVDVSDAVWLLRASVGLEIVTPDQVRRGDIAPYVVDYYGAARPTRGASATIDVSDAVAALRASVGLIRFAKPL